MKKIIVLSLLFNFLLSLPSYSCIVYSTIGDYEASRKSKGKLESPFDTKHLKNERVFERRYSLGSDLVLRVYTRTNAKNSIIYQSDLFMGNNTTLPGTDRDFNKLVDTLSCNKAIGIPKSKEIVKEGLLHTYIAFPSGITVLKVYRDNKLLLLQVFDRKLKKQALEN